MLASTVCAQGHQVIKAPYLVTCKGVEHVANRRAQEEEHGGRQHAAEQLVVQPR